MCYRIRETKSKTGNFAKKFDLLFSQQNSNKFEEKKRKQRQLYELTVILIIENAFNLGY